MISLAGGIVRIFSSFWTSVILFMLFVQFKRTPFSPFWDHFETVSPRKAHQQRWRRQFVITPPGSLSWVPGVAGGNTLIQPENSCLHSCSQIERCCRNPATGGVFIHKCDPQPFTTHFLIKKKNNPTKPQVLPKHWLGSCLAGLGRSLSWMILRICPVDEPHLGSMWPLYTQGRGS